MLKVPRRFCRIATRSGFSDKGEGGTTVNKKISDNCKKLSPVQIDVIKTDEGMSLREQMTHDHNRYVPEELLCKIGLNCYKALKIPYISKLTHIRS